MKLTREQIENMPNSELRHLVLTEVLKYKQEKKNSLWYKTNNGSFITYMFDPTKNIGDAWKIVETLDRKSWDINISSITENDGEIWEVFLAEYFENGVGRRGKGVADTAPLAFCRAALIAFMEVQDE